MLAKDPPLSELDLQVLYMRNKRRMSFKEIADVLGMKHYTQVQSKYYRSLEKWRVWSWLKKNDANLLKTADEYHWTCPKLMRLYKLLAKNYILTAYKEMTEQELLEIPGLGETYLDFLLAVRMKDSIKPPMVKPQVDDWF